MHLFDIPICSVFARYPDNSVATLTSTEEGSASVTDIDQIAEICAEPLIYELLFREHLADKPYTRANAQEFVNFALNGWKTDSTFVFLVRNHTQVVIAAIDIKSPKFDGAEIGYWASAHSPEYMTNAVVTLCGIARQAGFTSLFGLTRLEIIVRRESCNDQASLTPGDL